MQENEIDVPEFTDEQLRAALLRVGKEARERAFAAGLPVVVVQGKALVAMHPDGSVEFLEALEQQPAIIGDTE